MSFCVCGGYLGNGGPSMFAGRHCTCANPRISDQTSTTLTSISIPPKIGDIIGDQVFTSEGWVKYEPSFTSLHEVSLEELIEAIEDKGFKITLERNNGNT
jgi:hypothetical protein